MSTENKKENIEEEITRAAEVLREAEILAENKLYTGALSRLYYYVLHYISALLLSLGLEPKTHEGAERLFSKHFVKTKLFEHKDAKFLAMIMKYRWSADYNSSFTFDKTDFEELLAEAKVLSEKIKKYLKSKHLL